MTRLVALVLMGLLSSVAWAHKLQVEPIGVTLRVQDDFLQAELRGNVQDITQSVDAQESDERGERFNPEIEEKVEAYFNTHFTFRRGGQPLPGKLLTLTHETSRPPEEAHFALVLRYPLSGAPEGPLQLTNTALDFLPNARFFVSAGGATRTLAYGQSLEIDTKNLVKSVFQNILEFAWLGIVHIAAGIDHLLFIFALLLAARTLKELALTLTGFTLAHSVTLALAALGILAPPAAIVEPLIALSIVYVGVENLFGKGGKRRFLTASAFGLMHGFGFAGVLSQYLPAGSARLWCLFSFNVGVELLQLALCALFFPLVALLWKKRSPERRSVAFKALSIGVVLAGGWFLLKTLNVVG